MVTRNEAERYLELSLASVRPVVDELFVFDDQSTDTTVEIARNHGCIAEVRSDDTPPFLAHEGQFRQGAWDAFCERLHPQVGDWILAVDADEIVVSVGNPSDVLRDAASPLYLSRVLQIPEVFDVRCGWPYVRVDGAWGKIQGTRFFAWRPGGVFADRSMASGSEPTYISARVGPVVDGFWLLHLGYAREGDRHTKYERYSARTGHSNGHVESIRHSATLHHWDGPSVPGLAKLFA